MKKFIVLFFISCFNNIVYADDIIDINLEVGQGFFKPFNNLFNEIYGNAYPTFFGIGFKFNKYNIQIITGLKYFNKTGETIIFPPIQNISSDKIKFVNVSIPLHFYYRFNYTGIKPFILGGLNIAKLREKWLDIPLSSGYTKIGFEIGGGITFYSRNNWSLSAGLIYSFLNIEQTNKYINASSLDGTNIFIQFEYKLI